MPWYEIFTPSKKDNKDVLKRLDEIERLIKMNQAELAQKLSDLSDQIQKGIDEVINALNNAGTITPEVQAALDNLSAKAQALDDLNPDQPGPGAASKTSK